MIAALGLALVSDSVAFLSNVTAGIPSVIQFGIGATIALVPAFVVLGVLVPLAVARIDAMLEARPGASRGVFARVAGGLLASVFAGAAVLAVIIFPPIGIGFVVVYLLLFVALPLLVSRRSAVEVSSTTVAADAGAPSSRGEMEFGVMPRLVGAISRARLVFLPLVLALTVISAVFAVRVEAAFDVKDFFSSGSDFTVSLDKIDEHIGDRGGEPAIIYVEADLTDPEVLATIDEQFARLDSLRSPSFARDDADRMHLSLTPSEISATALSSEVALARIEDQTGVSLTDADGDGIVDTPEHLAALFRYGAASGIALDEDRLRYTANQVRQVIWQDETGTPAATQFVIQLPGTRAVKNIEAAQDELTLFVESFTAALRVIDPDARVAVTGGPFARQKSLDATYRALQLSLPIAVVLCFVVVAFFMRSIRFAFASIVPIVLVVAWLYAFMYFAGFTLNLVTATIGAISVGVGIDYAIHFTMRFREEVQEHARLLAVQRTAASTGNALVGSAVSSVVGFAVMSFAPMPLFASYGLLTAVMILLAAAAALVVLPPLLVLITSDPPSPEVSSAGVG